MRILDLRVLSQETKDRARWGEPPAVVSPSGLLVECCGELMKHDEVGPVCQVCGERITEGRPESNGIKGASRMACRPGLRLARLTRRWQD